MTRLIHAFCRWPARFVLTTSYWLLLTCRKSVKRAARSDQCWSLRRTDRLYGTTLTSLTVLLLIMVNISPWSLNHSLPKESLWMDLAHFACTRMVHGEGKYGGSCFCGQLNPNRSRVKTSIEPPDWELNQVSVPKPHWHTSPWFLLRDVCSPTHQRGESVSFSTAWLPWSGDHAASLTHRCQQWSSHHRGIGHSYKAKYTHSKRKEKQITPTTQKPIITHHHTETNHLSKWVFSKLVWNLRSQILVVKQVNEKPFWWHNHRQSLLT